MYIIFASFADASERTFERRYNVTLHEEISPTTNKEFLRVLKEATSRDVIVVDIDSPGGMVTVLNEYTKLINEKDLYIIATVRQGNLAASCAAVLLNIADKQVVEPTATVLFHLPFIPLETVKYGIQFFRDADYSEDFTEDHMYLSMDEILKEGDDWNSYLMGHDIIYTGEEYMDLYEEVYHDSTS